MLPWLDEFIETYPQVSLKLNLSDSNVDFYRDSIDIALRYGFPKDANLYGFKICNVPRLLCATPEYLRKHGTPTHPDELTLHNGLFYQLHDIIHDVWSFSRDGKTCKVKMTGNRAANDGDLVRRWCVSGKGIAAKSSLDMAADLLADRVTNIMPEFQPTATELWIICPSRQSITPAVRLLRDELKRKCTHLLEQLASKGVIDPSVLK